MSDMFNVIIERKIRKYYPDKAAIVFLNHIDT